MDGGLSLYLIGPVENRDHTVPRELGRQPFHRKEPLAVGLEPNDQKAWRHFEEVLGVRSRDLPALRRNVDRAEPQFSALLDQGPRPHTPQRAEISAIEEDLVSAGRPVWQDALLPRNLPIATG